MVTRVWEIDESTVVAAHYGLFLTSRITVNDVTIGTFKPKKKHGWRFALRDGRKAHLAVIPQFVGQPAMELRIDGRLMLENGKQALKCRSCGAAVKPFDRFCEQCGKAMPSAEWMGHEKQVKEATRTIFALAVLFVIGGVLMYFLGKENTETALAKLRTMDPDQVLPNAIDGVTYTVRELRQRLEWESTGALVANLILAAAMGMLGLWSRRAPLAAVFVATALYAVMLVVGAIINPASIAQGFLMKILVVALLVKGCKAALAMRELKG